MEILIRATVIYWFLWLVVRGTGKRSLAELTPMDLLVVVVLGDLVQQGVTQEDMSVTGAVVAVSVFILWTLLTDYLSRRSQRASAVLNGAPAILVRSGRVQEEELDRERISLDDLKEAARQQGYGDLGKVELAVLETDGKFSFIGSP